MCGEQRTTWSGPDVPNYESENRSAQRINDILDITPGFLAQVERAHPGTLLNNCSYALWRERYARQTRADVNRPRPHGGAGHRTPLEHVRPREGAPLRHMWNHISDWTLRLPIGDRHVVLLGCTEDVRCTDAQHADKHAHYHAEAPWHCRTICPSCTIPTCQLCLMGLRRFHSGCTSGTISMAISDDNYYGYVHPYLIHVEATILVYYLEGPYGHLMLEEMAGASARTQVRWGLV